MSKSKDYIFHGPKESKILFRSYGKYLFDCLRNRNSEEVLAIDALESEELTCGALLERSVKFTEVLKKIPIKKGDMAALVCENTFKNFTPTLSLLYLGVPIHFVNFAYSLDEMRHAFKISQPKLILCSKVVLKKILMVKDELDCVETVILIDGSEEAIKSIDDLIAEIVADVDHFKPVDVNLEDTACLCMSSGTTGLPKCVELTHGNFNYCVNYSIHRDYLNISENDVTVFVLPFFHIYGVVVNFSTITASLKIVLIKAFKPEIFLKAIVTYKATKLFLVPSLLHFLCTYEHMNKYDISFVSDMQVAGSYLSEDLYKTAIEKFKNTSIRQFYGATELTGACSVQNPSSKLYSVGSLAPNASCKIIDVVTGKAVAPGNSGEICISGSGVANGYHKNPVATKNSIDSDNFYHTGDFGYYNTDGLLFIIGRIKEMIKYKGFQVSPSELEVLILSHPAVDDCAVIGINDEAAGELPMACVVLKSDMAVTEDEIIKFVAERISPQKRLHGGVKFVEKIPRTELGKLQRNKLIKIYGIN